MARERLREWKALRRSSFTPELNAGAHLRSGQLPTDAELEAMNLSESEALGQMVLLQMEGLDDVGDSEKAANRDNDGENNFVVSHNNLLKNMVSIDTTALMDAAKNGTRHGGVYIDAKNKKKGALEKSISSHTNQVLEHAEKIKYPAQYDLGWNEKDARQKEGLLRKWEKDLKRNAEQAGIEIEVWKELYENEH